MRVNLSGADTSTFEPMPAGRYVLRISDHEVKESGPNAKHPGAQYINWEFDVQNEEYEGRKVWTNTMLTHEGCDCENAEEIEKFNKSLGNLVQLLLATGEYTKEDLADEDLEIDFTDLYGTDVGAVLKIRKSDEYGDSNEVKRFKPLSEMGSSSANSSLLP